VKSRAIVLVFLFLCFFFYNNSPIELHAQSTSINYKSVYLDLLQDNRLDDLFLHLQKWETAENKNPEMYVAWFNYYVRFGSSSGIAMGKMDNGQYGIYDQRKYVHENVFKGISYLDKGLEYSKNRLDMYFGKITALNQIADYQKAGDEVMKLLQLSKEIKNTWLWSDNEIINNGEHFFINSVDDYYRIWLNAGTEISLNQLEKCTIRQIELFPQYVETYNFLSIYYLMNNDFYAAIPYLEMALTIDGNDEDKRYVQQFLDRL
jgi:tetratricopeptide (TPR) repeat protein